MAPTDVDVASMIKESVERQLVAGARSIDDVLGRAVAEALGAVAQPSARLSIESARAAIPELDWQPFGDSALDVTDVDELANDIDELLWSEAIVWLLESYVGDVDQVFSVAGSTAAMMSGDGFSLYDFSLDSRTYFFASGDPQVCAPLVWFAHAEGDLDARRRAVRHELEANSWFGGAVRIWGFPDLEAEAHRRTGTSS